MNRIVLLTTLYKPVSNQRAKEYDKCLSINCRNMEIDRIVVFFEDKDNGGCDEFPGLKNDKIKLIPIEHRPTYRFFFDYANKNLEGDYAVVCNADIYYDEELNIRRVREVPSNHLWALCRYNYDTKNRKWDLQGGGLQGSSDSWIFKPPVVDFENDIAIGVPGCDSYLCQKAVEGGIVVSNPALSIITKHEHESGERNRYLTYKEYPDYMQCGYTAYCPPASEIKDNVFATNKTLRYRLLVLPAALNLIRSYRKIKEAVHP